VLRLTRAQYANRASEGKFKFKFKLVSTSTTTTSSLQLEVNKVPNTHCLFVFVLKILDAPGSHATSS